MSEARHSLILAEEEMDDTQLLLWLGEHTAKVDRSRPKFDYSGERLLASRPDVYHGVVKALADPGVPYAQISRVLNVSFRCIKAVEAREEIPISTHRKKLTAALTFGTLLAAEQVIEKLPAGNLKDSAIALNILANHLQLTTGGATARVETVSVGNIFEQFSKFHEKVEKMVSGHVVDPLALPNTGLTVENVGANGELDDRGGDPGDPESDAQSDDSRILSEVNEGSTASLTDEVADREELAAWLKRQGGGGGSALPVG